MNRSDWIRRGAEIELARRHFFDFCKLRMPDFYKPNRTYLVDLCNDLEEFLTSDDQILVVNEPPRHGKSLTATNYVEWLLGRDGTERIMTGSYNETLSTVFSKSVRNTIQEVKADDNILVYNDIFPDTHIKYGDAAMNMWSLEGSPVNNYLATSPSGTATGFGADLIIIDDVIKSAQEANNANRLDDIYHWYIDTMLSRLEKGGKVLIIMTRWASGDLAGRVLTEMPKAGYKVKHINMKALQDDGTMLCDDVLSLAEYKQKTSVMSPEIAAANYQQEPIDLKGTLYQKFNTYTKQPEFSGIYAYCDTADEGSDYLVSIVYGMYKQEPYILDVVMTQEPMEVTESLVTESYYRNKVNLARIESNNGGKGFARQVDTKLKNEYKTNRTVINWFHNSQNKDARILSNSSWVEEHMHYPEDWKSRFPVFFDAIKKYQRAGKNLHDDASDALTGVAESVMSMETNNHSQNRKQQIKSLRNLGLIN
ncbi:phage terminase large subunit [Companilactobacillus halodurans]|uniref:Terminase n=1 Tax=Companilactobacillus halodurans TaxID=2584183 RepID=A0A5P0ZN39_9LACO|nr:phage terminase large subunit [Companilactobacillus halodurans]MQS75643.1 terminase [Companilactobacillus halodurans]MQS96356.1 terminase [Companilactobacillus halodurans]